jgi:murein DD-endopeptidase MepM/ murein hydrolase activator NlpD
MRAVIILSCWRSWFRLAVLGLLAAGFAGCSADTTRFGNPNANPYASRTSAPAEVTGSVQAAPTSAVSVQALPPPPAPSRPAAVATTGVSGGGQGLGSYNPAPSAPPAPLRAALPPPPPAHDITGSVPRPAAWNWDGGTAVVVGPGETAASLSRKYGVPEHALLQANGLTSSSAIRTGQRIVIPRYNYSAAPAPIAATHPAAVAKTYAPPAPAAAPVASAPPAAGANVHVVAPGETLISLARRYHKSLKQIAAANNIAPHTMVKIGDRIVIPGKLAPARSAAPAVAIAAPRVAPAPAPAPKVATTEATPAARVATAGPQATADAGTGATASAGAPAFRWPLRGRVIAGFGPKTNGQQNDGIDLSVPEGTAVHAAEDGVVAYAGNELKGYGNLILIRHANGFVTAYAHASEIMVKRNDTVRRGQVIAKSGQTGTVTSPQLHFEIRKGSSPVDPSQYLPTGA